jgi:hypothetical protein
LRDARYLTPDYLHRNLRFWYTPDTLESQNVNDAAPLTSWRNIANICYPGHWSADCTQDKISNITNLAPEILIQRDPTQRPIFRKNVLNGFGAVRFSRTSNNGSAGQFMQIETDATSNITGFSVASNPFQTRKGFTIFMVVRTVQSSVDTGIFGILNLASSESSLRGLSIFKKAVTCLNGSGLAGLNCFGTVCNSCANGANTSTFGTLNAVFGSSPTEDDNSCSEHCSAGCDPANPPLPCRNLWGPSSSQNLQDSDSWHVLTLSVFKGNFAGFVDGYHASSIPPLQASDVATAISRMQLGLMANATSGINGFATMDVAEMMIYNSRLTVQEMDRVGNYLSVKFNLRSFRLNYDVGSPTRSVAISKGCGCTGPSMLWLPSCNTAAGTK